ncbi:MAG: hypothetical protein IIA14_12300, partial [SAR324 cluster bacterium]|nr:hypothetical protein [SAR324 cluster bacterium]
MRAPSRSSASNSTATEFLSSYPMVSSRRIPTRSPVHRPAGHSSRPPSEPSLSSEILRFGLFYRRQEVAIGLLAVEQSGGRWLVHTEDNGPLLLPEGRLLYRWEAPTEKKNAGETAATILARLRRKLGKEARTLPVAELHATLAPGKAFPFEALAQKAIPREGEGPHPAVLFFALLQNHGLFRFSQGSFLPRSSEEISRRKREAAQRASEARWQRKAQQWQEALGAGLPPPKPPAPSGEFFRRLESLVAFDRRSPFWDLLAGPLGLRPSEPAENGARLKGLLEAAGQWRGWPRMWLQWGGVAENFPPALEKKAASLAARPVGRAGRSDFGKFPTFSFDPPGTQDFDDACSILAADSGSL